MRYTLEDNNEFIVIIDEDILIHKLKGSGIVIYTEAQKKAVESYNSIDYPTVECWYEEYDSDYIGVWPVKIINSSEWSIAEPLRHVALSDKDILRWQASTIVSPYKRCQTCS